jgi:hypothetical protein
MFDVFVQAPVALSSAEATQRTTAREAIRQEMRVTVAAAQRRVHPLFLLQQLLPSKSTYLHNADITVSG